MKTEKNNRKENMKSEKDEKGKEVWEMFSAAKLVEDAMKHEGLTVDLVAEAIGKPVQYVIEIIKHVRDITVDDALFLQRRFGWPAEELLDHQIRDLLARFKAYIEHLKIWGELWKLGVKERELEALSEKFLALIEKTFPDRR